MRIKNLILIFAAAALLSACTGFLNPDLNQQNASALGYEHDGKVTLIVKPDFPQLDASTKALGSNPEIENLYVAVFDSTGYKISEYVKAEPFTPATSNDTDYQYTIELKVSEKPRILHFIANGPEELRFGSEIEVIGELYTTVDENGAYWQRIVLPTITARPEDGDEDYDDKMAAYSKVIEALDGVKLVRNFSKMTVEETCDNFDLEGFWFVNYADRGSIAPYNRNTGRFMDNFIDYPTIESLEESDTTFIFNAGEPDEYSIDGGDYQGFMLATTNFIEHEPFDDAHIHGKNDKGQCEGFVYEREKALLSPMYIIVKGKFTKSDNSKVDAYYKIAMQDGDGDFYAMLRNFDYLVQIQSVASSGYADEGAALAGVPSGDISVNVEYQNLPNISDGDARMTVSETTLMIIGAKGEGTTASFWYKYEPDITGERYGGAFNDRVIEDPDNPKTDEPYVTINFAGTSGSTGDVISSIDVAPSDDAADRRLVTIHTTSVGDLLKTQSIVVTGKKWDGAHTRYQTITRTINLVLRETIDLTLSAAPNTDADGNGYVEAGTGKHVVVNFGIEGGLPSSMFPLEFKIDPLNRSLTPDNDFSSVQELPVRSGLDADRYPTYWFEWSLSWADYNGRIMVDGIKTFPVYFATIIPESATEISVSQKYFKQGTVEIFNFVPKTFSSLTFHGSEHKIGVPENFSFSMSEVPSDGKVTVAMKGLEPDPEAGLEYAGKDSDGYWVYTLNGVTGTSADFDVVPFASGQAEIKLSAHLFNDESKTVTIIGGSLPVGTDIFNDTFGTKNVAISAYDGNGVTSDYNKEITYSLSGNNTNISTTATTNMASGHIRFTSSTRNDTETITLSGINPFGAKKVTLSFSAYLTTRVSGTSSVNGSTAQAIISGANSYDVTLAEGATSIEIRFVVNHYNGISSGTLGIDNVKLTIAE